MNNNENAGNSQGVFKVFKTQEEYQQHINNMFNMRFKDYMQTKEKYESLLNSVKSMLGESDETKALEGFSEASSSNNYQQLVDKGKKYDEMQVTSQKNEEVNKQKQSKNEQIKQKIFAEAQKIAENDKSFDLQKLYQSDEEFKADLNKSGSVYEAYMNWKARTQKKSSFKESGNSSLANGKVYTSVADLPDDEFAAYIEKIKNENN